MRRFVVFSGFLGSGKTSTMMALTQYFTDHHGKAAMISNDLGGQGLADYRLALFCGCNASEITGECICFCHKDLMERLNTCYDAGCELVISDIPGFGVGALEHVYHGMEEDYPGQLELGPFTVLVEPRTVSLLRCGQGDDMASILNAQLMEADLIVLNKCDLLTKEEQFDAVTWLSAAFPHAGVISISALKGDGLEELSQAMIQQKASMHHPAIDYEDAALQHAMGKLSEYYLQYRAEVCCNDFDGNAYLLSLGKRIQEDIQKTGCEIPHLKLLAWDPEGDYGKVDLLGTDRQIEVYHAFTRPCTDLAVVLNTTAACPGQDLEELLLKAIEEVSKYYQLDLVIFRKECIDLGEEE